MSQEESIHVPVLLEEVLQQFDPRAGEVFVDGTLGGGGHTRALLERVGSQGSVIAIDHDPTALDRAERTLTGLPVKLVRGNFCDLPEVLESLGIEAVDGILLDLGISSDQLADATRGFSFDAAGPLDLRMDASRGEPAWRMINRMSERHLADLIYEFGEERYSRRIARRIVGERSKSPVRTSAELAQLIRKCVPQKKGGGRKGGIDPATRTFQALRIAVNSELKSLEIAVRRLPDCLRPGGRIAIISFHSLEDRPVKHAFRSDERLDVLTPKPIRPTASEIDQNPRCRSARLRVARRV